jgi:hypothetical protein
LISGFVAANLPYYKIGIYQLPTFVYVIIFFMVAFGVSMLSHKIHAAILGVLLGFQLGAIVYTFALSECTLPYVDVITLGLGAVVCAWFSYYNAHTSMIFTTAIFGTNLIATSIGLFTGYTFGVYNLIIQAFCISILTPLGYIIQKKLGHSQKEKNKDIEAAANNGAYIEYK